MRRREDFESTVRRRTGGRRVGSPLLVAYLAEVQPGADGHAQMAAAPPVVGFVVARSVGNAVRRNAVKRRLRALVAARLHLLPPGSGLVVRAAPAAAESSSAELGEQLDALLHRLLERAP
ncbi:MAG: ribonuclease P protein component [Actinomycetota bacterium]|nr:ribonuclease P protein component [Actinomycetota bacterium]